MRLFPGFTLFLLLAGSFLLSGCGASETRVERGNREGILHVGNGAEPQNLDPQTITGIPESKIVSTLFEGLVELDPETLRPAPAAAARWEVSEDGRTYTFFLQPEGRWSNGEPVMAEDFVTSYRRKLSPRLASQYAYMLFPMVNAEAFHRGELSSFEEVGVRALDERTLEIRLAYPVPYFLSLLTHSSWFPIHPATIKRFGALDEPFTAWTRPGNLVGNGAFTLTSWRPDRDLKVSRNPHYWRAGEVSLAGIVFYPISNATSEERAFRTGQLHITETIPPELVPRYRADERGVFQSKPSFATYYFRLNVTRPPLDDARVRRALLLTIDRTTIVENLLRGGQQPAYGFTPPGDPNYQPGPFFAEDAEKARRLLAEAGFPNGEGFPSLTLLYNTSEQHRLIAEAVQDMWQQELGINISLLNQEWQVYLDTQNRLNYDISRSGWVGDYMDANTFLDLMLSDGGNNRTGWGDPAYDALIREASRTGDLTARAALFKEAEALLLESAPVLPVYFYRSLFLQDPSVHDYFSLPTGQRVYRRVRLVTED